MTLEDHITISMITYALQLENGKYYVGKTWNLNLRWAQHQQSKGARWTQLHKPISIMEVWEGDIEKKLTLSLMREFGWENVRGAGYCALSIKKPRELLSSNINGRQINICNSGNNPATVLPDCLDEQQEGG